MRERGAYSPLTHTPHTPHPHPQHTHTPLRIRPFRRSSPPSRAPPSVFSRTNSVHTHPPHSSIHPSITLRQGGATGLPEREQEKRERMAGLPPPPFSYCSPLGQPPRRLQPTPSLAGRGKGGAPPPPEQQQYPPLPMPRFFSSAFTPLQAFSQQAAGFSPFFSSTSHTPSSPDTIGRPPSRGPFAVPL